MDDWILNTLRQELESAKEHHQEARERFWKVTGRPRQLLPRDTEGVPHPDGSLIIRKAAAEETHARKVHLEALIRMNAYLINGSVPEDLAKKSKSASGDNQ